MSEPCSRARLEDVIATPVTHTFPRCQLSEVLQRFSDKFSGSQRRIQEQVVAKATQLQRAVQERMDAQCRDEQDLEEISSHVAQCEADAAALNKQLSDVQQIRDQACRMQGCH